MILSKLNLHTLAARQIGESHELYKWHQYIWETLGYSTGQRDFLYRVEETVGKIAVYILSESQPNFKPNIDAKSVKINPSILQDETYKFSVTCNPVKQVRGSIIPLRSPSEIKAWFERVTADSGCTLRVFESDTLPTRTLKKAGKNIPIHTVEIQGYLTVNDTTKFVNLMAAGIGRQRAFGYGLITLSKKTT